MNINAFCKVYILTLPILYHLKFILNIIKTFTFFYLLLHNYYFNYALESTVQ